MTTRPDGAPIRSIFRAALTEAAQLLWPARCAGCNDYVPEAAIFCGACAPSVTPLLAYCPGCALPYAQAPPLPPPGARCATCRRAPFPFVEATAGFEYGEALADAIVRMKHTGRRDLGARLGRALAGPFGRALASSAPDALVLPVPLHPRKLRRRGFNQALELARAALAELARQGVPRSPSGRPRIARRLLLRIRDTPELGHAGPAARLTAVAGAFAVADPARIRGRRVLLVDDVFTTGATFTACAGALLEAGAREVRVIALARAV